MRFRFHTVLPIDECRRRLERATDRPRFFGADNGSAAVVGRIGRRRFHLYRRSSMGNAFAPHLYGFLEETGRGTSVLCSVRVPLGTVAFFTAILGFILFVATMSIVPTPWSVPVTGMGADLGRFVGYPIILAAGVLLVVFGRRLARGEDAELIGFARDSLLATDSFGTERTATTPESRGPLRTVDVSGRERLVQRLWMGTGILGFISIACLFAYGVYMNQDPEWLAPYVFGSIAIAFGTQLVIFGPDHDHVIAKQFPDNSDKFPIPARAIGLFFIFVGAAMVWVR
jgi:hypothetical protein